MTPDRRRARGGWALVVATLLVGAVSALAPVEPTAAAVVTPVHRTDGVEGRMQTHDSQVSRAHVWDLEVVGRTVYVAGKFRRVVVTDGWVRHDQPFLAAFDTVTGRWISTWRPRVDRPAYTLTVLPSGSILAGGEFTRANGAPAQGLVALHPVTGATDTRFTGTVGRPESRHPAVVRDLEVREGMVYVVGQFSRAIGGGSSRLTVTKAVRFAATTGRPDGRWRPRITGRSAWTVAVSTDGRRVHLGGEFSRVGNRRGTSQLATVTAGDGSLVGGWDHGSNARPWPTWPVGGVVFDLDIVGHRLHVAGAEHFWEVRDSRNGRSLEFRRITNDAQSVDIVGGRAYIGCHCFRRDPNRQVWEVDATTGAAFPGRTGALRSGDGTWATAVAADGCLWLGGDFNVATSLAGRGPGEYWVGRIARLCPPGVEAGGGAESSGPVNPPGWHPDAPA